MSKEPKFENALKELEEVVAKLDSEELPLEDALTYFEKGISLSKVCTKKLEEAEKKVDVLLKELASTDSKEENDHVS